MKIEKSWLKLIGVAAVVWMSGSSAQDPAAPAGDQAPAEGAASATEAAPSAAPEAPAVPVKPRPSEMMPLAARGLMLDVTNTGERLVAVGDHGDILVSTKGEAWTDWAQVQTPVRSPFTAVSFADTKNGWAVGHDATIVHTSDGGKTWTLQNFQPDLEKPFLDVLFIDNQHGFAIGAYGLYKETLDGGQTWTDQKNPVTEAELHLNCITRLGNGDLFIAGEQGTLGVSGDQGKTWTKLTSPYESSLFGALPVGEKGAMIYGLRANVYVTQDVRSNKWTKINAGTVNSFFGGTTLPDGRKVLVGLNGILLVTDAQGGSPHLINTPLSSGLSGVVGFKGGVVTAGESGMFTIPEIK